VGDDNDLAIGSYGANTFTARTTGGARFISAIDPNTRHIDTIDSEGVAWPRSRACTGRTRRSSDRTER
jgi:hypothetical protein